MSCAASSIHLLKFYSCGMCLEGILWINSGADLPTTGPFDVPPSDEPFGHIFPLSNLFVATIF